VVLEVSLDELIPWNEQINLANLRRARRELELARGRTTSLHVTCTRAQVPAVERLTGFVWPHQYDPERALPMEIGACENFRFFCDRRGSKPDRRRA
jgi:hypothetical protein